MSLAGEDILYKDYWGSLGDPSVGTGSGGDAAGINAGVNKKTLAWQIWKDAEDRKLAATALNKTNTDEANLKRNTSNYYTAGSWKNPFVGQRDSANTAANTATGSIDTNLATQLGEISGAYGDATKTTTGAYNDLISYLTNNPNNPYAGKSVSAGQVGNDMSQLMQAYGVDSNPTQQYVGATNAANNSTAQQFNNLLQLLSGMSTSSDASRMTEARSGSANALSELARMNASNVTGANSAATGAKNTIVQDLFAQLSGIDSNQAGEDERLRQLLITLGVDPSVPFAAGGPLGATGLTGETGATGANGIAQPANNNLPVAPTDYGMLNNFLPGVPNGVDETTRVPEVTPQILQELQQRLLDMNIGDNAFGLSGSGTPINQPPPVYNPPPPTYNPPPDYGMLDNFLPGVPNGIDETTRVPEVTPQILQELQQALLGMNIGDSAVYNPPPPVYNPPPDYGMLDNFLPGVASGVDESTRVPEVTQDTLEELLKRLAQMNFGSGFFGGL